MTTFSQINSPVALAAFGAFFVPEPLGMCLVLAAGLWWLTQVASVVKARRWTGGKLLEFGRPQRAVKISDYWRRCVGLSRALTRPIVVYVARLKWPEPVLAIIVKDIRGRTGHVGQSNDIAGGIGCVSVSRSARRVGDLSADGKIPRQHTVS
jgi:hypothetical protein